MAIIDSQVHAYEANTPKRPWATVPNWPPHVTGDEMVAEMDKLNIDGAIFISPFAMYRYDASYAVEVQRQHPGRFAIVKPVDPETLSRLPSRLTFRSSGRVPSSVYRSRSLSPALSARPSAATSRARLAR